MGVVVFIVVVVLSIVTGNQVGDAVGSGLLGFVVGCIAFVVFNWVGFLLLALIQVAIEALKSWWRHRDTHAKIKSY